MHTPSEDDILCTAADLLAEHDLDHDWHVTFGTSRRAPGRCDFRNQRLIFSRHHINAGSLTFEQWDDVIRHELAHILAGPHAGHGPLWRKYATLVGATPRAGITPASKAGYKWRAVCPECNDVITYRHRLSKSMIDSLYHPACWDPTSNTPTPYLRWEENSAALAAA